MEEQEKGQKHIKSIPLLSTKGAKLHEEALRMPDSLEKAELLGKAAKVIESEEIPQVQTMNEPMYKKVYFELLALSLKQQGRTLIYYIAESKEIPIQEGVKILKNAEALLRKSHKIYEELGERVENKKEASTVLDEFSQLSLALSLCAERASDHKQIIDLNISALSLAREIYQIKKDPEQKEKMETQLKLAFYHGFRVSRSIASDINIFKEPDLSKRYKILTENINVLEKIFQLFTEHLLDLPLKINWHAVNNMKPEKKKSRSQPTSPFTISPFSFKDLPSGLAPQDYVQFLQGSYCGLLKGASNTVSKLVGVNDQITVLYQRKAQDHLALAIKTYREKIYQGGYKNDPEKESEFILASLENLAENEEPLMDFYAKLRLAKQARREHAIAQMIREEQEERQRQEIAKQKQYEEKRKVLEERAAIQRNFQTSPVPDAENLPSPCAKDPMPCIQKKEKIKTRGEAHPPSIEIIEKEKKVIEVERKIITLNRDNYYVFQCLTGENYNRNISLQSVITLLKTGFSCDITNAIGGGSHKKATAPNNYVWTIPPEWKGPIPAPYRSELMHFLLVNMGIIEGLLEVKSGK